jgi:hypothetical protein
MKKLTFATLVLSLAYASLSNAQTTVAYDFTATNFVDFSTGEPAPIEGVSGSFGFTFEPSDVSTEYVIAPDFVNLSFLGTDFTVENTAVLINDGGVIAIIFGGIDSGPNGIFPFGSITDFWLVAFINDDGSIFRELFNSFCFSPATSDGFWCAQFPDVIVTQQVLDPGTLIEQLSIAVIGVGPGSSLSDKLVQAKAYLDAGDSQAACEMLNAFLNQVRAQRGKKLSAEFADQLTIEVMEIIEAIGCG